MRDNDNWKKDLKNRATSLSIIIEKIKPLYGQDPVTPLCEEIAKAFALSLIDIGRYCKDNNINAKNIDTVKLLVFSIPYLLTVRNYALRLDMYVHACLIMIHGKSNNTTTPDYEKFISTIQVARRLCLKFPSQYMVVYGYLKGYQESLEINT